MNPKIIATISAVALVTFVFCFITTLFALGGYVIFQIIGDASVTTFCRYVSLFGIVATSLSLLTAIISNIVLVSLRF